MVLLHAWIYPRRRGIFTMSSRQSQNMAVSSLVYDEKLEAMKKFISFEEV